jgi:hypothetical protein
MALAHLRKDSPQQQKLRQLKDRSYSSAPFLEHSLLSDKFHWDIAWHLPSAACVSFAGRLACPLWGKSLLELAFSWKLSLEQPLL